MATEAAAPVYIPQGKSGAPRTGRIAAKYLVVMAVMPSAIMEILDASVVNVSLPHIGGSLGGSVSEAAWVLTSYLVANAVVVPLGGWLSHRFGRKRLLLSTVTGFTVSSVLCGLAPTLPLLVFFRVMQGLTGGGLQPLSQSILFEEFPVEERQHAMSIWAFGVVLAPIFGPTLGGWITDTWALQIGPWHPDPWRWVFFINVPIGILSWRLIAAFVHEPEYLHATKAPRADVVGIILLAFGMASFQTVLDRGEQDDWFGSRLIVALTVAAVVLIVLFVIREASTPHPFVKVRLFGNWNFGWGSCIGFLMYSTLFGSIILVPLFMETVLGWTAGMTGFFTMPRGLGAFVAILLQQIPAFKKIAGNHWMGVVGFTVTGLTFAFWFSGLDMNAAPVDLFWPQFVQGVAATLAFLPIVTGAMAHIDKPDMRYATSLFGTVRNMGQGVGISFVTIYLDRRAQVHHAALAAHASVGNPAFAARIAALRSFFLLHRADAPGAGREALGVLYQELVRQANLLGFLDAFRFFGFLLLAVALAPLLLRKKKASA